MENTVISHVDQPQVPAVSATGAFIAVFFLAWLALIFVLGARGVFVAPRGAPPLALLIVYTHFSGDGKRLLVLTAEQSIFVMDVTSFSGSSMLHPRSLTRFRKYASGAS